MRKIIIILLAVVLTAPVAYAQTVSILDTGMHTSPTKRAINNYVDPACFASQVSSDGSLFSNLFGMCTVENVVPDFDPSLLTITAPRTRTRNSDGGTDTFTVGSPSTAPVKDWFFHGTDVSNALWDFSRDVFHQHNQVWSVRLQMPGETGGVPELPLTHDGRNVLDALEHISRNPRVDLGAVNISLAITTATVNETPDLCIQEAGLGQIKRLKRQGIAVVVGLLNKDLAEGSFTWPACFRNDVIGVARNDLRRATGGLGIGIGGGVTAQLNFFAKGTVSGGRRGTIEGNSLAAPRVAGFYALLHDQFPLSRVIEKTAAIANANDRMHTYTVASAGPFQGGTYTRRDVRKSDLQGAIDYLQELYPIDLGDGLIATSSNLDYQNDVSVGPLYQETNPLSELNFSVDFSMLRAITSNASNEQPAVARAAGDELTQLPRDIEVTFVARSRGFGSRQFEFRVNNRRVKTLSGNFDSAGEREVTFSFILNRNELRNGENTFVIKPVFSNSAWGIKSTTMKFLPIVPLTLNRLDTNEYGYEGSPTRFTGMRASVDLPTISNPYIFEMTGWDIDVEDEAQVFVNGTSLGFLNTGASSAYSTRNKFLVPQNKLRRGANYIELVQRRPGGSFSSFEDEKWAVKDILVRPALTDLTPTRIEILDKAISKDKPFELNVTVNNIGDSASPPSTAQVYISADVDITSNDELVQTYSLPRISINQSNERSLSISSEKVNKGFFIGVCLTVPSAERSTTNNCSTGIPLEGKLALSPIIMLLLGDE